MWNLEIPTSRLQNLLSVGFVVLVFGSGVAWQEFRNRVAEAQDRAAEARAFAIETRETARAQIEELKRDIEDANRTTRRVEEKQKKQDWMTYKILQKVDPAAASMIPAPPEPKE